MKGADDEGNWSHVIMHVHCASAVVSVLLELALDCCCQYAPAVSAHCYRSGQLTDFRFLQLDWRHGREGEGESERGVLERKRWQGKIGPVGASKRTLFEYWKQVPQSKSA